MITIEAIIYGLDGCIRGGQLVSHEVIRVLDGLGFPYDPVMRAFSLHTHRRVTMDSERLRIENEKNGESLKNRLDDPRILRGAGGRTSTGDTPGRAVEGRVAGGEMPQEAQNACSRVPAREILRQRAYEMRRKASQLEALASAIPDNFPGDADAALWDLALSVRTY